MLWLYVLIMGRLGWSYTHFVNVLAIVTQRSHPILNYYWRHFLWQDYYLPKAFTVKELNALLMMKNLPCEIQLNEALLTAQYSYTYFYTIFWKDSVVHKLVYAIYYTVYIHGVKDKQKEKIYGLASLCIDNPLAQLLAEIICSSCSIMLFSHFPKNIWGLNHLEKVLLLYNEKHSAGKSYEDCLQPLSVKSLYL